MAQNQFIAKWIIGLGSPHAEKRDGREVLFAQAARFWRLFIPILRVEALVKLRRNNRRDVSHS